MDSLKDYFFKIDQHKLSDCVKENKTQEIQTRLEK
jgi:hypothetical protein